MCHKGRLQHSGSKQSLCHSAAIAEDALAAGGEKVSAEWLRGVGWMVGGWGGSIHWQRKGRIGEGLAGASSIRLYPHVGLRNPT